MTRKEKNEKAKSEKNNLRIDESIKLDKSSNPKNVPRHLISFPSHYHFMSNINIGKKKRKK